MRDGFAEVHPALRKGHAKTAGKPLPLYDLLPLLLSLVTTLIHSNTITDAAAQNP